MKSNTSSKLIFLSKNKDDIVSFPQYIFIFVVLVFIPPVIACLILFFLILLLKKYQRTYLYLFIILVSVYLGTVNATKLPESDLEGYFARFMLVSNYSFLEYLSHGFGGMSREPFSNTILYLGHVLTFGNFRFFIFIFTAGVYIIQLIALYKFLDYVKFPKNNYIFVFILFAFFPLYFTFTAHTLRQILAMAFVVFALVSRETKSSNAYFLYIIAILTHMSTLLFLPLFIFKMFANPISFKSFGILMIIIGTIFTFVFEVAIYLAPQLNLGDSINYLLFRFSDPDTLVEIGSTASSSLMFGFLGVIIIMTLITKFRNSGVIAHAVLLIFFVVLFTGSISVVQYRTFLMSYSFVPFVFYPFYSLSNNKYIYILYSFSSLLIIAWFIKSLIYSPWHYGSIVESVFQVPFLVILGGYS